MSTLLRLPPVPRHDPQRDGNPFAWIIATAPRVRAQQAAQVHQHRQANKQEL
ncbi:MAG: hypothetical protein WAQ08_16085 [Aquabacterium sp.]|uniref:hypothetical protein n=1 Tax=Aquabacterium sp. TaxID=1872578 RepID=UPI003BB0BFB1